MKAFYHEIVRLTANSERQDVNWMGEHKGMQIVSIKVSNACNAFSMRPTASCFTEFEAGSGDWCFNSYISYFLYVWLTRVFYTLEVIEESQKIF